MPRKVPLSMRSVGSSDDGAVIRVATAWLGQAMQWLLVRVRVITLTQTSCAIVRSASEVHNSAESWLRRPAEKACCQDMARAARVIEPWASDVVLDTCHRLQTAGTTPLRSRRPPQATRREESETTLRHVRDISVGRELEVLTRYHRGSHQNEQGVPLTRKIYYALVWSHGLSPFCSPARFLTIIVCIILK